MTALVNKALVTRYFGDDNPLGKTVRVPRLRQPPANLESDTFEIVGVVGDTLTRDITEPTRPELYVPYSLIGLAQGVVVRTDGEPERATALVRAEVAALDRDQPLSDIRSLESALNDYVFAGPRFGLTLFAVFATLGSDAGRRRRLRRHRARREPPHAGDWRPDGAWRHHRPHRLDGAGRRGQAHRRRHRHRAGRLRRWPRARCAR